MKINRGFLLLALMASLGLKFFTAHAQGTAFTYNGRLNASGSPANGGYDLTFTLYNAATNGTALGSLTNMATPVANGLFTVTLDFGSVFSGSNYWLQIAVRTNGGAAFASLAPLQPITPTPYAIYSETAANANSVAGADITGIVPLAELPAAVVTNNEAGVTMSGTFNGTFTGNGGGLTGLTAAQVGAVSYTNFTPDLFFLQNLLYTNFMIITNQRYCGVINGWYDGTNFNLLSCPINPNDGYNKNVITLFQGTSIDSNSLSPVSAITFPPGWAVVPGGVWTENNTNYIPIYGNSNNLADFGGSVFMAYAAVGQTNFSILLDGNGNPRACLSTNGTKPWDQLGAYRGSLIKNNGLYYIFYNGHPTNGYPGGEGIGFATATNIFGPYTNYAGDPVYVNGTAGDPMFVHVGGIWEVFYNNFAKPPMHFIYSYDLTNWINSPYNQDLQIFPYRVDLINSNGTYFGVGDTGYGGTANGAEYGVAPVNFLETISTLLSPPSYTQIAASSAAGPLTNISTSAISGGFSTNILIGGHAFYITNGLIMNVQ
jgi:hypothetical protein